MEAENFLKLMPKIRLGKGGKAPHEFGETESVQQNFMGKQSVLIPQTSL